MVKNKVLKKVIVITMMLFMFAINYCYADVYISPEQQLAMDVSFNSQQIFDVAIIAFALALGISAICLLIGKLIKEENLRSNSRKAVDTIFYLILVLVGLKYSFAILDIEIVISILSLLDILVSLFVRFKLKKKIWSYITLGIWLVPILVMLLPELKYMF
ncbi:MAG: hypothetical protein IJ809_01225 [Clostridia bacterium]|nr:hypothetical protein [Clostridia bacterium]